MPALDDGDDVCLLVWALDDDGFVCLPALDDDGSDVCLLVCQHWMMMMVMFVCWCASTG